MSVKNSEEKLDGVDVSSKPRSMVQAVLLVSACTLTMMVNSSNVTAPSVALPTIGRELNIPENRLQWIVSAYSLTSGCLLLFFGRVADLYGRKKIFTAGLIWLIVFTLGCGFCQDEITLNVLRGLQGVGSAAVTPASVGILAHAFPSSRARAIAFSTYAAGSPVGAAIGTPLGGVLTQLTPQTWRSTFFLSTALTVLCLATGLISIDSDSPSTEDDRRIDWPGAFLVTAGLVLVVFVLGQGEVAGWDTPYILALLIIGTILVVLFLFWQRHLEIVQTSKYKSSVNFLMSPPLMKVSLWGRANGRFAAILAIAFLNWCCFVGWNFWLQLYYQEYLGLSPVLTMVRLLPMIVTGILCNIVVALIVNHVPIVVLLGFGTVMTATASLLFALIIPEAPYWAFGFPATVISVFGVDFTFSAGSLFIARAALPHEQSVAGALFQTMTQLGATVGVTVTAVVFDKVSQRQRDRAITSSEAGVTKADFLPAYKAAQWAAFAFGVLAIFTAIMFFRGVGAVGQDDKPKQKHDQEKTISDIIEKEDPPQE